MRMMTALGIRIGCLALACNTVSAASESKTRVALVIGNARYESAIGPLRNSLNDAKAVSKALRNLGFSVIEKHNTTRNEMLSAVQQFRSRLQGTEVALFYFAGHGFSLAGSNYLVPTRSGYEPQAGDATAMRMLAETKLFNAEQVVAEMATAGSRCNIVILDACRNTPVARDPSARDINRAGLAEMKPPAGSLIAFATDAGHTASDGSGKNGLYTGELITHLTTPGITIEQVFKRTRASVMEKSNGKQIPAEYSRLVGDDIYLAGLSTDRTIAPAPRAAPIEPPSAKAILHLATTGQIEPCIEALQLTAAAKGPGEYAAAPIGILLESAKEQLISAKDASPQVEAATRTCRLVLSVLSSCLPPDHRLHNELAAKANNRLGDCLMLDRKPEEALKHYESAIRLAPDDAYPVYNRGRAYLSMGKQEAAAADFTKAAGKAYTQPAARKMAEAALKDLQHAPTPLPD